MLGKLYKKVKGFLEAMYFPYDVVKDSRGVVAFRVEDGGGNVGLYSVEELLGMYGIDKDFSNGSLYVVFYDMGASSTYAALVYFSAYNAKKFGNIFC
ncbi:hypothetical protein OIU77_015653 [Salix suchowensis]|uniref:Uncharacterized protein n=1 Tax=Salix suchowensis TaxID=1278906 RepID=A0ABQ8ZI44_9ROSI|nr:hypothetical protein OIU77_015653 [Salix suchowensis]